MLITDIDARGESAIPGASSSQLATAIAKAGHPCVAYVENHVSAGVTLRGMLQAGDVVVLLGTNQKTQFARSIPSIVMMRKKGESSL